MLAAASPFPQSLVLGGSELLRRFFDTAQSIGARYVHILTPYVDVSAFDDVVVGSSWRRLLRTARTTVVVRTDAALTALVKASGSDIDRCDLRIYRRLHAKVFVAWRPDGIGVGLLGSHNLTGAALHANAEAGLLVRTTGDAALLRFLGAFRELTTRTIVVGEPVRAMVRVRTRP